MSLKTSFPSTIIKYTIPQTAAAFTNGGLPIGSIKAGRYLCILSYALDPVNGGATINSVNVCISAVALFGNVNAIGLIQQNTQPATSGDVNTRITLCSVVTLTIDAPIYISISPTVSAGDYRTVAGSLDSQYNNISFIQLQS